MPINNRTKTKAPITLLEAVEASRCSRRHAIMPAWKNVRRRCCGRMPMGVAAGGEEAAGAAAATGRVGRIRQEEADGAGGVAEVHRGADT